ncbi:uncharacterized protein LOC114294114 [Camellia sinensis]|uniref:uncharacterized protein LOC114294114 n=1 Tax=Camellia sinensis TaxID=4442 RepID=UPI001035FBB3|nr:uncharacterized protein LOC114294114 [Camellia sinensis]
MMSSSFPNPRDTSLSDHLIHTKPNGESSFFTGNTILTVPASLLFILISCMGSISPSMNPYKTTLSVVKASMAIGCIGALLAMFMRRQGYAGVARCIQYVGGLAYAFGFLGIASIFLPATMICWVLLPAGGLIFIAFKMRLVMDTCFKKIGDGHS